MMGLFSPWLATGLFLFIGLASLHAGDFDFPDSGFTIELPGDFHFQDIPNPANPSGPPMRCACSSAQVFVKIMKSEENDDEAAVAFDDPFKIDQIKAKFLKNGAANGNAVTFLGSRMEFVMGKSAYLFEGSLTPPGGRTVFLRSYFISMGGKTIISALFMALNQSTLDSEANDAIKTLRPIDSKPGADGSK